METQDRFVEIGRDGNGARIIQDEIRGVETTVCPYIYKGSPCESPADVMWAMSCPRDYTNCSQYKQLEEENGK